MLTILRPLAVLAVQRELRDRFSAAEIRRIVRASLDDYDAERPALPEEAGSARAMLHLAALSIALYRSLLARVDEGDARRVTAAVIWRLFRGAITLPTAVAGLTAPPGPERLRRATDLLRQFAFHPPGYVVDDAPCGACDLALDVTRCPVADHFRAQGLPDLCVDVFCQLEDRLAAEWGASLERSGTLAAGADRCDLRWHLPPRPSAGALR